MDALKTQATYEVFHYASDNRGQQVISFGPPIVSMESESGKWTGQFSAGVIMTIDAAEEFCARLTATIAAAKAAMESTEPKPEAA
jgi:hypothetical protein